MTMYMLDEGRNAVAAEDIHEWGVWWSVLENRRVAETMVGDVRISTVFLGLDHNYGSGAPILFETMTFGIEEEPMWRYCTWDEAVKGHDAVVEYVRKRESKP